MCCTTFDRRGSSNRKTEPSLLESESVCVCVCVCVNFVCVCVCMILSVCWPLPCNPNFYRQIAGYGMGVGDHRVG